MPNAISAVGTQVNSGVVGLPTTFNVNPTAVGNMIGLAILFTGSNDASAVSGGNCTWTKVAASASNATLGTVTDLWLGVATATGSAAITTTTSASSAIFVYQEFAGGGTGTPWAVDGSQAGSTNSTSATTSAAYPTLVPGGASRLYWGFSYGGSASGVTSGYTLETISSVFSVIYNVSVSTSQSPVVTQGSSAYQTCGALIVAGSTTAPTTPASGLYLLNAPMRRSSLF